MAKHIIDDAKRCVQCKNPMCSQGCPIKTPVRDVIKLLLDNKVREAGEMLFENNPLSLVCSYVCPQSNQCEGHCIMGKKGSPVFISAIEQYISDYYLNIYKPEPSKKTKGRIAIIGSGPAGITIAFLLAEKDYDVTIFEGNDKVGGILRYGIPEFRLPKVVIDKLTNLLIAKGVKIRPNTTIGMNISIDDLFRDDFKAVFMGTGVWRPNKLNIKGESLGHVHFAIEYLRSPDVYDLGKSIIIIGAGNVAMDVARTAFRHGVQDVLVACIHDETSITAHEHEVQFAKIDGTRFEFYKKALEITESGVVFLDTLDNTEKFIHADSVIVAVSQGPRSVVVSSTSGIKVGKSGLVDVDDTGHSSRDGVFAGGDVVTGAKTVVEAVAVSRKVAENIDKYVMTLPKVGEN
jgi:glutamate synthase (NADPH/NADH) small chain